MGITEEDGTTEGANSKKTIAPVGWHVPSDAEWTTLTEF
jgi:uncharacterized protein (TIGR02145 family)